MHSRVQRKYSTGWDSTPGMLPCVVVFPVISRWNHRSSDWPAREMWLCVRLEGPRAEGGPFAPATAQGRCCRLPLTQELVCSC